MPNTRCGWIGAFLAMAIASIAGGCGARARILVTRPAMVDASAAGNTFTVGAFAGPGEAANQVRRDLEQRITHSLNPSIRLLARGGGLTVDGEVVAQRYDERVDRDVRTCTRQVQTGTNSRGQAVYQSQPYSCTYLTRVGEAQTAVRFRLVQSDGAVLFDRTYSDTNRATTSGIESQVENRHPPAIDGRGKLARMNGGVTEQFSRVILPWQDQVVVGYEGCGDERCGRGFEMVRAGDLAGGERLFTEVIGTYDSPSTEVPPELVDRIAQALYNRGVTRGYMGRYAPGVADLVRACTMRPGQDNWRRELENIQRLGEEQEALRSQGVVATETQEVESAGAP